MLALFFFFLLLRFFHQVFRLFVLFFEERGAEHGIDLILSFLLLAALRADLDGIPLVHSSVVVDRPRFFGYYVRSNDRSYYGLRVVVNLAVFISNFRRHREAILEFIIVLYLCEQIFKVVIQFILAVLVHGRRCHCDCLFHGLRRAIVIQIARVAVEWLLFVFSIQGVEVVIVILNWGQDHCGF